MNRPSKRSESLKLAGLLALLWLGLALIGPAHAGTKHYYYTDAQGTVLAKTDAQGNIIARYDYKPYGAKLPGPQTQGPTGYTGHVNDAETGLVYMQARYYDPVVGRFLSVDPVGPKPGDGFGFNRYAYGNNNPILNIDPDGRFPFPPLRQLTWFHQSVDEYIVNPVKATYSAASKSISQSSSAIYSAIDDHVNITLSEGVAAGPGVGLEVNVLHPDDAKVNLLYGEGANVSIDVAPKNGLRVSLFGNSDPGAFAANFTVEGGSVLHGGLSLTLDSNGNFEAVPKIGLGVGELATAGLIGGSGQGQINVKEAYGMMKQNL